MSGLASVLREWIGTFAPGLVKAPSLFDACLITSFVGSCGYAWYLERRQKLSLEKRLAQRPMRISEEVSRRLWRQPQGVGAECYIKIINDSEGASLESVRVELIHMEPEAIKFLPVPLHIKHEDYEAREFSIHPLAFRQVDLVTGPTKSTTSPTQTNLVIPHTVKNHVEALPGTEYRLTVKASAKNVSPVEAVFKVSIEDGELQCVRI
jgi:hypothetical protein